MPIHQHWSWWYYSSTIVFVYSKNVGRSVLHSPSGANSLEDNSLLLVTTEEVIPLAQMVAVCAVFLNDTGSTVLRVCAEGGLRTLIKLWIMSPSSFLNATTSLHFLGLFRSVHSILSFHFLLHSNIFWTVWFTVSVCLSPYPFFQNVTSLVSEMHLSSGKIHWCD